LVRPGVSGWEIDEEAERLIRAAGGLPAFKGYGDGAHGPFPATICFSLNEEVVHGIPTKQKIIKSGDVVKLDIGMEYPTGKLKIKRTQDTNNKRTRGYYTDTAITVIAGEADEKVKKLLADTKESLYRGISASVVGASVVDIGRAVQSYLEPKGYGIVRDLVGHGVGHEVHEEPRVPNFVDKSLSSWILEPGVVIAIEPMVTLGDYRVRTAKDGWGIATRDNSLTAHFEHTVVITKDGPVVATLRPGEKINY
jgi:methionyl aminopeptidase